MNNQIDPNKAPIQNPYDLFRAMLGLIGDESVAVMRQHIAQMSGSHMQNICSEVVVMRQRARNEAEFQAGIEQAARDRKEMMESRARTIADRETAEAA